MKFTKIQPVITYILECPHCGEQITVNESLIEWAQDCVNDIGYGNDYADDLKNLITICDECEKEFIIDGVNNPEIE